MAVNDGDKLILDERVAKFSFREDEDTAIFFVNSETGRLMVSEFVGEMVKEIEEREAMAMFLALEEQRKAGIDFDADRFAEEKEKWRRWQEDGAFDPVAALEKKEKADAATAADARQPPPRVADTRVPQQALQRAQEEHSKACKRYDHYDENIKTVDRFIETLDPKNKPQTLKALQGRIDALEIPMNAEADVIKKLVDQEKYDEARLKIDQMNAKNLQIGTLKDMMAVVNGQKEMYNKQGEKVGLFKDADFIVPSDKQLIKEGEKFYLLGKDEPLTDANRNAAEQAFLRAEPELSSVKNLIAANRSKEMGSLGAEVARLQEEITKLQAARVHATAAAPSPQRLQPLPDHSHPLAILHAKEVEIEEHQHLSSPP